MSTTTTIVNTANYAYSISVVDFIKQNKIPFVKIFCPIINGEKKIRATTIPKGWMSWDFEKCNKYNEEKADPKCNMLNINLSKSKFMIIDIDDKELVADKLDVFGDEWVSFSSGKKLPH
jgi:hypothetical protein